VAATSGVEQCKEVWTGLAMDASNPKCQRIKRNRAVTAWLNTLHAPNWSARTLVLGSALADL